MGSTQLAFGPTKPLSEAAGPSAQWSPPEVFDGYELGRLLGRGGMGTVYLAHDTFLDRPVAIKFISRARDEMARKRFLVEARAIARLTHPNVVSIYRVGEVAGAPYLVSEYVEGQALDGLVGPVAPGQILKYALDIASALAAAHRRGVVHRDIKPANAILSQEGDVKLLDFGIAKLVQMSAGEPRVSGEVGQGGAELGATRPADPSGQTKRIPQQETLQIKTHPRDLELTEAGAALGTPRYMAPEIWGGAQATFRSDIYSFGALVYTLCTGGPPHKTLDPRRLAEEVQRCDIPSLGEVASSVGSELVEIVDRCLMRDPMARYANGSELRSALVQLLPEARDSAVPEGNPYRGLHAFEREHKNLYFGRDSEVRMILERLVRDPVVLVAGDSGVGKSSLCRAGVLPRLSKWFELAGRGRNWQARSIVPGQRPVEALAEALAPLLDEGPEGIATQLLEDPSGLARRLRAWGEQHEPRGLVLLVDQLEELVTISDPEQRLAVAEFLGWLCVPAPGVRLLAAVRGDFLTQSADLPRVGAELSRALYFLRPLSAERIREAIIGPAEAKGVTFESAELLDILVERTRAAEGGLPLLQFALSELWEARGREDQICYADLSEIGGVEGALTRHADRVLQEMVPLQRKAARALLTRLVTARGTRARLGREQLIRRTRDEDPALAQLVRGRLVVARDTPEGPGYEIAHEVLIAGWVTLAGWLASDAEERILRERLRLAVDEWERLNHRKDLLWGGQELADLRNIAIDDEGLLGAAQDFLAASRRADRRWKVARWVLVLAVPLVGGALYAGLRLEARSARAREVQVQLERGRKSLSKARALAAEAHGHRLAAFALFDQGQIKDAEQRWSEQPLRQVAVRRAYAEAGRRLEAAFILGGGQVVEAREAVAEALYEQAILAEARHDETAVAELLARLATYDADGALRRRWRRPARIAFRVNPPTAALKLGRYQRLASGRYRLVEIKGASLAGELAPGSYLARFRSAGYVDARVPFVVARGADREIPARLLAARRLPAGFVYVPAGHGLFGSAAADGLRREFFQTVPAHPVVYAGFLIGADEVTYADWITFLEALGPEQRALHMPLVGTDGTRGALELRRLAPRRYGLVFRPQLVRYELGPEQALVYDAPVQRRAQRWERLPVTGISAVDARAYVAWLVASRRVPGARLCTEREWELAARGADGRRFPHGERLLPGDANIGRGPAQRTAPGPVEVGSYPASTSPFGVRGLVGNVAEWTRSSLAPGRYVVRGGAFSSGPSSARSAGRRETLAATRDAAVGLRVCADLPAG